MRRTPTQRRKRAAARRFRRSVYAQVKKQCPSVVWVGTPDQGVVEYITESDGCRLHGYCAAPIGNLSECQKRHVTPTRDTGEIQIPGGTL